MRIIKLLLKGLLFLVGILIAAWIFMPWKQVGEYSLSLAARPLGARGASLVYSTVETADAGFTVNDLSFAQGFFKFSFKSLTFRPNLLGTLLNIAPTCDVSFTGWEMKMSPPIRFGNGNFTAILTPQEVFLDRLRTDGDFAIAGFVGVDLTKMKISRAEAAIKVTEPIEPAMDFLKGELPLIKDGPGRWFLRRNEEVKRSQ